VRPVWSPSGRVAETSCGTLNGASLSQGDLAVPERRGLGIRTKRRMNAAAAPSCTLCATQRPRLVSTSDFVAILVRQSRLAGIALRKVSAPSGPAGAPRHPRGGHEAFWLGEPRWVSLRSQRTRIHSLLSAKATASDKGNIAVRGRRRRAVVNRAMGVSVGARNRRSPPQPAPSIIAACIVERPKIRSPG